MPFLHHPPSIHPSIHSSTGQNGWGYTAVTTKNPQWHQPQWLNTGNVCFLLTLFGLGAGRGAVSPIWRQGKWGAMPWPRPFCFYVVLADGNDRATPPSKDGCLGWVGGPTCIQKGATLLPSLLPSSATSLFRPQQTHWGPAGIRPTLPREGRVQQCVSPRAHVTVWMGRGAGLPGKSQTRFLDPCGRRGPLLGAQPQLLAPVTIPGVPERAWLPAATPTPCLRHPPDWWPELPWPCTSPGAWGSPRGKWGRCACASQRSNGTPPCPSRRRATTASRCSSPTTEPRGS